MEPVIISQFMKTNPIEGILLNTRIVSEETGEIYSSQLIIRLTFYLDLLIESELEKAIKKAEQLGYEVVAIDSKFNDMLEQRKAMLQALSES